ncbi:DEAD/DEAH box helicase [Actinokineospora fastidiosa]|uniref:ATP-dependent helicase n=1 Tax=Actinokineospora fastidiosa TaxID=1816 RepID=A0A918GET3_9PSEU|nr:DEAD/DEAH box helicase [Actinokineospora fastidiosa]GGS28990.1 ATP-dependent helicase [Actinokineospora fastidiosa]
MGESNFPLLHPDVQRWVYRKGWRDLHPVQDAAIPVVLRGDADVLIGASTASGKTEAAFLPICSALAGEPGGAGVQVLYVSPLKALINDQFRRVQELCEDLHIATHRWHGDVAASSKAKVLKAPSGILLTTPESLEAMYVLRGSRVPSLFAGLRYVVVDELHAFLGVERGVQLVSLLHRLETALRRRVPRIGLSATFGEMSLAAEQLRPGRVYPLSLIESPGDGGQEILVQVRAYTDPRPDPSGPAVPPASRRIAEHLHAKLRGTTNLAFANSRAAVEEYAVELARLSEEAGRANEFHPHHGYLAKELREEVEDMLRDTTRPATAVCTTTLEMGIDIGDIAQVAQIGPPSAVSSLRQRLGRSGRRPGKPAVLRAYVEEFEPDPRTTLPDRLHPRLVQTVAVIDLLLESWFEPPEPAATHLSTLVQQLLSTIAQHGGASARQAFSVLCGPGGPFHGMPQADFATLLRDLGDHDVLTQMNDGTLVLGVRGEQTVNHHSFYAAFHSADEYRLVAAGRTLGAMPIEVPLFEGMPMVFAGRRWRVPSVDPEQKVVELAPAPAGRAYLPGTASHRVHTRVRTRMRQLLSTATMLRYLDTRAQDLLTAARAVYRDSGLDTGSIIGDGPDTFVFHWCGDKQADTLAALLRDHRLDAMADGIVLVVAGTTPPHVRDCLAEIVSGPTPEATTLAEKALDNCLGKYDDWISDGLLTHQYAARMLDVPGAITAAAEALRTGALPLT